MADTVEKTTALFFQEGSSDKLYQATLIAHDDGSCSVSVQWGRRGSKQNEGSKAVRVARPKALSTFDKLLREKLNKGYQAIVDGTAPAAVAPPDGEGSGSKSGTKKRPTVGPKAQLLNPIDDDELARFLDDDGVIAQQKLDGFRVLCTVQTQRVLATNREGQETDHCSAALLSGLESLPVGTVVDGEVVGNGYWLFDVLRVGDRNVEGLGALQRWQLLDDELSPGLSGEVQVLRVARTAADKRKLYEDLVAAGAEGIVFKDADAPYQAGRPASGGSQRKHKLIKSCDVVISENSGNAYTMVVVDGAARFVCGKVFAGTTNASRKLLDAALARGERPVCEVRYLYATDDEQLFQPVFVRQRDDKDESGCARAQLQRTNRGVLT